MTTSKPKDEEPSEDKNPTSGEPWLEKATKRFIQPDKVKVGVYDIALGILPVALTFHGTLAADYGENSTLNISKWIYVILIFIVLGYCSLARWYAGAKENHGTTFLALTVLIIASFMPVIVKEFGASPSWQLGVTLLSAITIVVVSQYWFSLPDSFRKAAKNSPPLPQESCLRQYALCNFVLAILFAFLIIRCKL